jgi:methyl-accepting chemotaxis protein
MTKDKKYKRVKNIKITRALLIMWCISLVTTIASGFVGHRNTKLMHKATNDMYTNAVPKLKDWGEINGYVGILRNTLTKIIERPYDENTYNTMLDLNSKIRKLMEYNAEISKNNKAENELVLQAKNAYEHYYSFIPDIMETRKKGLKPDLQVANVDMGKYGTELSQKISDIVALQQQFAKEQSEKSRLLYINNNVLLSSILGISVALLTIISILVTIIIRSSIKEFTAKLEVLSNGDFSVKFNTDLTNEFGVMNKAINKTIGSISEILKIIKVETGEVKEQFVTLSSLSEQMSTTTNEVSSAIEGVAKGSASQAEELVETNSTLASFGDMLGDIKNLSNKVDENTQNISTKARISNDELANLTSSIKSISATFEGVSNKTLKLTESVRRITEITDLINSIADQTNLLSLNASIEAARAGEAGRGFAVVADEIRKLAEKSKESSSDITTLLNDIKGEVDSVVATTKDADSELTKQASIVDVSIASFKDIIVSIEEILPDIDTINKSVIQINKEKEIVISATENISAVAEENSASAEEILASTEEMTAASINVLKSAQLLNQKTDTMIKQIDKFTLVD